MLTKIKSLERTSNNTYLSCSTSWRRRGGAKVWRMCQNLFVWDKHWSTSQILPCDDSRKSAHTVNVKSRQILVDTVNWKEHDPWMRTVLFWQCLSVPTHINCSSYELQKGSSKLHGEKKFNFATYYISEEKNIDLLKWMPWVKILATTMEPLLLPGKGPQPHWSFCYDANAAFCLPWADFM